MWIESTTLKACATRATTILVAKRRHGVVHTPKRQSIQRACATIATTICYAGDILRNPKGPSSPRPSTKTIGRLLHTFWRRDQAQKRINDIVNREGKSPFLRNK